MIGDYCPLQSHRRATELHTGLWVMEVSLHRPFRTKFFAHGKLVDRNQHGAAKNKVAQPESG